MPYLPRRVGRETAAAPPVLVLPVPSRLIFSFSFFSSCRCRCGERRDERGQSGGDGLERVLLRQRAEEVVVFWAALKVEEGRKE